MLTVRDFTVHAGSRALVHRVSFEASAGRIFAIIGPNGSGKTTLLEAMVGVRRSDSGTVALSGRPLRTFSERAGVFAYLPDGANLAPELDVGGVVEHALRQGQRAPELVDALRTTLSVSALLDIPCGVLSRGERQRVALFCALAIDRPVVVLDEPFASFDPLQLRDVMAGLRRIAETGSAIITTVHQLGDAEKTADGFLLLADGQAIASGDLGSLRREAGVPDGASLEDAFVALLMRRANAS